MALFKQVVMIDEVILIGEYRQPRERPGRGYQYPRPEERRPNVRVGSTFYLGDMCVTHSAPRFPRIAGYASKWKAP